MTPTAIAQDQPTSQQPCQNAACRGCRTRERWQARKLQVGGIYRIPRGLGIRPRGHLTIRVTQVVSQRNGYATVIGWRVRPDETNVSFGQTEHAYFLPVGDFDRVG